MSRLSLLALCACSADHGLQVIKDGDEVQPLLSWSPEELVFAPTPLGAESTLPLTLRNEGEGTLYLDELEIEGGGFTLGALETRDLGPGEEVELPVIFTAATLEASARLHVLTNDLATGAVVVPLSGQALYGLASFEPQPMELGSVVEGEVVEDQLWLYNRGTAELTVSALLLTGEGYEEGELPALPLTLAPAEGAPIPFSFSPRGEGEHLARALAETDSPAGSALGQILAWSGVPVASCAVSPEETSPLTGEATWIGSESDDVDGSGIAEYSWTIVSAPDGSAARMPEGGADREGFVPDLAGTYVAELVVKTSAGAVSAPCQAVLEAVPQQRLWVELSWDLRGDDLDLHLLAPGGELESESDCHYRNCLGGDLDWGEVGESADDPRLDLDDVEGTGPENINLDEPQDGLYTVIVHDFPGSVDNEDNTFTVNIWVDGVWLYREWYTVDGEDSYSTVATVSFPEGLVTWPDGYTASP